VLWSGLASGLRGGPHNGHVFPRRRTEYLNLLPAILYQAFEEPTHSRLSPNRAFLRPVLLTACDASRLVNSYGIRITCRRRTHRMEMTHEGRREPPFFLVYSSLAYKQQQYPPPFPDLLLTNTSRTRNEEGRGRCPALARIDGSPLEMRSMRR